MMLESYLDLFVAVAAPILTAIIGFLLTKYFKNKPNLVAYYGHVSSYAIPNQNYFINLIELSAEPKLENLDRRFLPMLIKYNGCIWIYGKNDNGTVKLTKAENVEKFKNIAFSKKVTILCDASNEIYEEIAAKNAHHPKFYVGTHAIVVINSGKLPAKNVRLGHQQLPPNYNITPSTRYEIFVLPNGSQEIIFPIMVPNEQITISYLYEPPLTYNQINTYIKSDEMLAKIIKVLPTRILPKWLKSILYVLIFIGGWAFIYYVSMFMILIFRLSYCN